MRYGVLAFLLAWARVATTEDVVPEVGLGVRCRAASGDPSRGGVEFWPLTSVRRAAIGRPHGKHSRARRAVSSERIAGPTTRDDPQASTDARERREGVRRGHTALPAARREALELASCAESTREEIAARTAVACGTARGRLRLARAKLRTSHAPAPPHCAAAR